MQLLTRIGRTFKKDKPMFFIGAAITFFVFVVIVEILNVFWILINS